MSVDWIGSALEAPKVDSRVSNEDVNGGRPESQSPKVMPQGSEAIEMPGFWGQGTEDQAQRSVGDFCVMCVLLKSGLLGSYSKRLQALGSP